MLRPYIQLVRPINAIMMAFAVLIGTFALQPDLSPFISVLLGLVTAFTLNGASMVANDYWDRYVDSVNEPTRPIPSGRVTPRQAIFFAIILSIIGLTAAFLTNRPCFVLAVLSLLTTLIYSWKGKLTGLVGNLMVSAVVAAPFLYGGLIPRGLHITHEESTLIVSYAVMAFISNTGREITKDIVDVEGDKIRNVNTLAIQYGSRTAATVSIIFYLIPVVLSIIVWLLQLVSWIYLPLVAIADIGFIWSSYSLFSDYSRTNAKNVKNKVLIWMIISLVSFIVGGI